MQGGERGVVEPAVTPLQAKLVQGRAFPRLYRKRPWADLCIKRAAIPGGYLVERCAVIGHQPHENIDASRRAFRIGRAFDCRRQGEALIKLDQVNAAALEHGAVGDVHLLHDKAVFKPGGDGARP